MDCSRLNQRTFLWAITKRNYLTHVHSFMTVLNVGHLLSIDSGVLARDALAVLNPVLDNYFEDTWHTQVNRLEALCGPGKNKLRTYRTIKTEPGCEAYVKEILSRKQRSAMAKIRSGTAPIRLETGRYERPLLPPEERICQLCDFRTLCYKMPSVFRHSNCFVP